jgi:periplasmic protein TonB
MSPKPQNASAEVLEEGLGSLNGCFVDGDPEQRKRAQRVRRRALAISILVQSLVLFAVVVLPLLAKPEPLVYAYVTPIPPYGHYRSKPQQPQSPTHPRTRQSVCHICPPTQILNHITTHDYPKPTDTNDAPPDGFYGASIPGAIGEIPLSDSRNRSPQPVPPAQPPAQPRIMHLSEISPAMLVHRVEPVYPALPRQIHKEGKVELHALIGTDGAIQSLQVVAGDPLFIQSALDAVTQWRYRPTTLNGVPVEVDTHITVVYTLNH